MTTLRFSGSMPWWSILLFAIAGAVLIARWYWQESKQLSTSMRWVLPFCRGAAFFFILFMLAGPTLYHQRVEGELSRIRILLDNSSSMSTADVLPAGSSRLDRALVWLLGEQKQGAVPGWLKELRRYHRVDLLVSNQSNRGSIVWDSQLDSPLPEAESIGTDGSNSPLGERLSEVILYRSDTQSNATVSDFAAVLLISDGQCNEGMTLPDAAARYVDKKIPVFAIGVGGPSEPDDVGILQIEHSQRVYRPDRLLGTILMKERMKAGTPYILEVQHTDKTVFSKTVQSLDQGLRRIEFDIPAEILMDQTKEIAAPGVTYSALPIDLQFSVDCKSKEISLENNTYTSSLWGVERKNRVLILDRRGGWETRYIKNAFARDAAWDSTVSIGRSDFLIDPFPSSRASLFEFDLIVASYETIRSFTSEQQNWISDFVSVSGGGLIVVDNQRQGVSQAMESSIAAFMPIRFADLSAMSRVESLRVSQSAKNQPAFQIGSAELPSEAVWSQLPVPKSFRAVELAAGAESMVELVGTNSNKPIQSLVVTKLFGQGRVLYFAADETWRWRYEVADRYHQRFWSQIATWVMRTPFAVNDSFASLDSGGRLYSPADPIVFRARLKKEDSRPLMDAAANIILERNGQRYLSLPLDQEHDARGFYRTTSGPLPEGRYRVRLEVRGMPSDALSVETQFVVQPSVDVEMQTLACNQGALSQTAKMTGGEFLMIDDVTSVSEKLKRFRTGSIVESQTLLWQSYPWFATIVVLLSAEWYLRKRAGLI